MTCFGRVLMLNQVSLLHVWIFMNSSENGASVSRLLLFVEDTRVVATVCQPLDYYWNLSLIRVLAVHLKRSTLQELLWLVPVVPGAAERLNTDVFLFTLSLHKLKVKYRRCSGGTSVHTRIRLIRFNPNLKLNKCRLCFRLSSSFCSY